MTAGLRKKTRVCFCQRLKCLTPGRSRYVPVLRPITTPVLGKRPNSQGRGHPHPPFKGASHHGTSWFVSKWLRILRHSILRNIPPPKKERQKHPKLGNPNREPVVGPNKRGRLPLVPRYMIPGRAFLVFELVSLAEFPNGNQGATGPPFRELPHVENPLYLQKLGGHRISGHLKKKNKRSSGVKAKIEFRKCGTLGSETNRECFVGRECKHDNSPKLMLNLETFAITGRIHHGFVREWELVECGIWMHRPAHRKGGRYSHGIARLVVKGFWSGPNPNRFVGAGGRQQATLPQLIGTSVPSL